MTNPAPPPAPGPEVPSLGDSSHPEEAALGVGPALGPTSASAAAPLPADPGEAALREIGARRRDKIIGLAIVGVTFVLGLGVSVWAKHASRPETSAPPGPPTTEGVRGFPYHVDVVGTLPAARNVTKRTLFKGFIADGVRSDGTVDLTEGPGRARYIFQSLPGRGPQPADPNPSARHVYCGRQEVQLRHEGLVAAADQPSLPCPPRLSEPLPDPQCSLAEIWRHALSKGIPSDRVARIEYYRANAGPAWRFDVREGGKRFVLYGDCRRELKGAAAAGHAP